MADIRMVESGRMGRVAYGRIARKPLNLRFRYAKIREPNARK